MEPSGTALTCLAHSRSWVQPPTLQNKTKTSIEAPCTPIPRDKSYPEFGAYPSCTWLASVTLSINAERKKTL
jgi:hypothetical protein